MSERKSKATTSPKSKAVRFASSEAFWSKVRQVAREKLQRDFPQLTPATLDRWAKEYGPVDEEPEAHAHLRAIRAAIDAAGEHLRKVQHKLQLVPDALEGPDRQLLDVLRELNMWPGTKGMIPALNHAERAVGFRAHDVLRDRRSMIEALLENRGVRLKTQHFALVTLAVGFQPTVIWQNETVSSVVIAETKAVREQLRRLTKSGSSALRANVERVLFHEPAGPRKR